jgi:hypothetical protein
VHHRCRHPRCRAAARAALAANDRPPPPPSPSPAPLTPPPSASARRPDARTRAHALCTLARGPRGTSGGRYDVFWPLAMHSGRFRPAPKKMADPGKKPYRFPV